MTAFNGSPPLPSATDASATSGAPRPVRAAVGVAAPSAASAGVRLSDERRLMVAAGLWWDRAGKDGGR